MMRLILLLTHIFLIVVVQSMPLGKNNYPKNSEEFMIIRYITKILISIQNEKDVLQVIVSQYITI
jgi:hypothetical protein